MAAARFEVKEAENGQHYWVLIGANGEPLAVSETYTRREDAERALYRVKALASIAETPRAE